MIFFHRIKHDAGRGRIKEKRRKTVADVWTAETTFENHLQWLLLNNV